MTETMIYDSRVKDLEGVISYGTLGLLNTIAIHSDDNPLMKKNILLINGSTIVRNCYTSNTSDKEILNAIANDFARIRQYFEMYASTESRMIVYFQLGLNKLIPEASQRTSTTIRSEIARLTSLVARSEALRVNTPTKLNAVDNVGYYGLIVDGSFAYPILTKAIMTFKMSTPPQLWLVSHCPIDYFLIERFPYLDIMLSHTGKILNKADIPKKVFGDPTIPFNRITYKLFGDKDFVKPACRNRPKAIAKLNGIQLRLKTEREIGLLAKTKLGIDLSSFNWKL